MKKRHFIMAAIIFAFLGYVAAGPLLVLYGVKGALEDGDSEKIAQHIDFIKVRESLKEQLTILSNKRLSKEDVDSPFAFLGEAVAGVFIDKMVDIHVSPHGLVELLRGTQSGLEPLARNYEAKPSINVSDFDWEFASPSRLVLTKSSKPGGGSVQLVLERTLLTWRIVDIRLPEMEL